MKPGKFLYLLPACMTLAGCNTVSNDPKFRASESLPAYNQETFDQYVKDTKEWLLENRVFYSSDKLSELEWVLPREYQPESPNGQGVLLVHGLGDSPYSFYDVAHHLSNKGYLVRTVLLPGHGSKVGDLQLPTFEDWQGVVQHQLMLLKSDTQSVWLGGYSTGASLVTAEAMQDPEINGLLLFSPAFEAGHSGTRFARIASYFVDWVDLDPEDNPLRYNSLPLNAVAVYHETTVNVKEKLKGNSYDKPVFMLMSEGDNVINKQFAIDTFERQFLHTRSRLVWLGEQDILDGRTTRFSMQLPEKRISNGSHMGLLFSPQNPFYGSNGTNRLCDNGQPDENVPSCKRGAEVWYSSYGYTEPGKFHARLTYNPYFERSMQEIDRVMLQR